MKKTNSGSKIRVLAGKKYYTLRRYFNWYLGGKRWALQRSGKILENAVFRHKTPLFRRLKNVDMWMQYNKVRNLDIAVQNINRVILEPGQTFSFWRLVGRVSRRKGYVEGMVLEQGRIRSGVGGGLCQLSNLIYWMTLHTPLTVIERHRHTYDVFPDSGRILPFGSGATCAYNYVDLQIRNDTNQDYQLIISVTDEYLRGEWRTSAPPEKSYKVYEKDHWITMEYWGGYVRHNLIYRKVYNSEGNLIDDEYVTENHAIMMYLPYLSERTSGVRNV